MRVPWTARRSNQSILKEISPEFSSEGLMLKLKLQSFGHLIQRTDSLEKTLMLGKIEGRRTRGLAVLCPMSESPSGKREGFQENATHKKGSLLLTRVRAPAASNAVVRGQRAPSPSRYTNL